MLKKTLIATAAIAMLGSGLIAMTTLATAATPSEPFAIGNSANGGASNLSGFIEPGQRSVSSEKNQLDNCVVKRERLNGQMVNVRICKTIF